MGPPRELFFTVARGPVPRDRGMARDRPSPYVKKRRFLTVARGPVPRDRGIARDRLGRRDLLVSMQYRPAIAAWRGKPSRMRVWHARALAYVKERCFFHRSAGPVTATRSDL